MHYGAAPGKHPQKPALRFLSRIPREKTRIPIIAVQRTRRSEWKGGRVEGWKGGRKEGRKDGRGEGWKGGRMEGWKDGRMEGWKDGRMEGWKDGRMEGWKDGRMEGPDQSFDDLYRPGGLRSLAAALRDESRACGRLGVLGPIVARFALPIFHSSILPYEILLLKI